MAKISAWGIRSRDSTQCNVGNRLKEVFKIQTDTLEKFISEIAVEKEIPVDILKMVIISECYPVDWKRWPGQWLKSGVRINSFCEGLDSLYWDAFKVGLESEVIDVINEWNKWYEFSSSKIFRLIGKYASVRKQYFLGRYTKDMFVIKWLMKQKNLRLVDIFSGFVNKIVDKDIVIAPYCWKFSRNSVGRTVSEVSIISVGE